ncbi:hypothetical protein RSOLAG22IIIB_04698 [Rhizoctonia solani]|uniref:Protein kinase domain-containing protein n=1 Tax=Rhizoctonia solani TaxID=456999 RepID=A0A0K6FZX5_9AGAM|nr:hypothetical protein RSOLAG22IIIB_04698 [Rhizoctonia solani]
MQNGSLFDHLVRKDSCNKFKFCIDLVETVEYLHGKGIIHGDIKGDNILISDNREVQLTDFGSATLTEYHTLLFTWTSPQFACSVRFTAPEILDESSKKHTIKSDIYALGMTILQILTGKLPYADDSDMRVLANVFRKVPPPRPRFDCIVGSEYIKAKLWRLLLRCWKHNPNSRPTATQVKQVLMEINRESTASA